MAPHAGRAKPELIPEFAENAAGSGGFGIGLSVMNKGDGPIIVKEWGIVTPDGDHVNFLSEWDSLSIGAGSEYVFERPSGADSRQRSA